MWDSSGNPVAPWNIDANAKVSDISAGEFVNIVLFDNGQIAAWGDTTYGVHPPSNGTPGTGRYDPYIPPAGWRFKKVVAGGHFVMALILDAPNSGLPTHPITGRTGEGWIISWGTWSYGSTGTVATGPGFRGYASGFTSPNNVGNPGSPTPAAVYTPPYDDIFAGHVVCGGIIKSPTSYHNSTNYPGVWFRPGLTHLWGSDLRNEITDQPTHLTFDHVVGGYSSWLQGVALLDYTNRNPASEEPPVGNFAINGWGVTPPSGHPTGVVVNQLQLLPNPNRFSAQAALCYDPNCDGSTGTPALTANDFQCFSNAYAAATAPGVTWYQQVTSYANCDGSTGNPAVTANDFICFRNKYVLGPCP